MQQNRFYKRVAVLFPLALPGPYDYHVPEGLSVSPGDFVSAPLGPRSITGVVWENKDSTIDAKRLKTLVKKLDMAPLAEPVRRFINWVADYTMSPPGMVLRLAIRAPGIFDPAPMKKTLRLAGPPPERMTPARKQVLNVAQDGLSRTVPELAREADVSTGVIRGLVASGTLETVLVPSEVPFPEPDPAYSRTVLSPAQDIAVTEILKCLRKGGFETFLLDGVTGSGKTEVYFDAVAETIRQGKQALILLPEIALTSQFRARFEARFGVQPSLWHSELTPRQRRRVWHGVREGKARVVVGARSALFLPFSNPGLIVVDEEHEAAFKQDEGVRYNARDMAIVRGVIGAFPVILASATPSLETMFNVWTHRFRQLELPQRHGGAPLPELTAIDMRVHPPEPGRWLSPALTDSAAQTLDAGEQVLFFLNRRGYAPLTLCRTCGHRLECPQCDCWLVEHRLRKELLCHHCGYSTSPPLACPACAKTGSLVACGPGVERIAEEAGILFPDARVCLLSSDNARGPAAHEDIIDQIAAHEVDVIIGTQIVAKGHHFPLLTLVGVVDADLGLENGDLRGAERTYQLLHQVAGRSGRAKRPGRAMLQTHLPEHPVMQALISGNRDAFLSQEAQSRERLHYPPYGRLAGIILSSPRPDLLRQTARQLASRVPQTDAITVLGPAPAPLALLRGRHRIRFLVKAQRDIHLQAFIKQWLADLEIPGSVRLSVDVDPYNFL